MPGDEFPDVPPPKQPRNPVKIDGNEGSSWASGEIIAEVGSFLVGHGRFQGGKRAFSFSYGKC